MQRHRLNKAVNQAEAALVPLQSIIRRWKPGAYLGRGSDLGELVYRIGKYMMRGLMGEGRPPSIS